MRRLLLLPTVILAVLVSSASASAASSWHDRGCGSTITNGEVPGFDWGSEFGPSSSKSLMDKWLESRRTHISMSAREAEQLARELRRSENPRYTFPVPAKSLPCTAAVDSEVAIAEQWEKWHARGADGGVARGINVLYGGDQYSAQARIGDFRCSGRWGPGPSQFGIATELRESCEHGHGAIVLNFAIAANPSY